MKWLEVAVTVDAKWQEMIADILMQQGIQGLEIVDPEAFRQVLFENRHLDYVDEGFIESFGNKTILKAYFHEDRDKALLEKELAEAFSIHSVEPYPQWTVRLRDDSEWKDNWKKHYKTFSISERILIKPSWETFHGDDRQIVIELDPGMAFGTGTHETTKMCAGVLDTLIKGNETVLDLGCGTGILGIIAAKLGASDVVCVDIDDAACKTAQSNICNNRVQNNVSVIHGVLNDIPLKGYDIIVMNIVSDVILTLLPLLKEYCMCHTHVILSGIIRDREQDVLAGIDKNGFKLEQKISDNEWVTMVICTDF